MKNPQAHDSSFCCCCLLYPLKKDVGIAIVVSKRLFVFEPNAPMRPGDLGVLFVRVCLDSKHYVTQVCVKEKFDTYIEMQSP